MRSNTVALQFLLGVTGLTQAQSPPGIFPQVNNNLAMQINGQQISAGQNVAPNNVNGQPTIGISNNGLNPNSGQKYLFMMIDLDSSTSGNTKNKRADATPAAPAASAAPAAPQQPEDPEHSGGRQTFLHSLVQDFTLGSNGNINLNGAIQLQSNGNGPVQWQPPNPQNGQHRYMALVFQQPNNFQIPASMQSMVQNRANFDLREFIQQANLPLPQWGTYFVIGNGNSNGGGSSGGNSIQSTSVFVTATTVTVPGLNGGVSTSVSQYLTTQTLSNGFNGGGNGGNGGSSGSGQSVSTFTTATTFPNGGPTQTFLTTTTYFGGNDGFGNGNGNGNGNGSGARTSTYLTTTTFPNGGPTQTFFTTSTAFGQNNGGSSGFGDQDSSGLIYSTGFTGQRTTTSTGPVTFSLASTDASGSTRSYRTVTQTTATLTISGVSRVTKTTFQTTATYTNTQFLNGQLSTATYTSSGLTTATRPDFNFNGAGGKQGLVEGMFEKAVLALVGAAWYFI
ncbi:hypothetical protein EJ08DRAFT_696086 [Tothia fuscella]|uniref:PEBP-like protein n=1 Tax=Tothia fuscella TaxID=1048955 RepID=A0A9P4NVF4_9PEZI|nr:hypothetical protein EJ08DRAFT_696086 [Tothia fuscella]